MAIFIEFQQLCTRIGNLIGINDPIVIYVQRPHNGGHRPMMPVTPKTRPALIRPARRWAVRTIILRGRHKRRRTGCNR